VLAWRTVARIEFPGKVRSVRAVVRLAQARNGMVQFEFFVPGLPRPKQYKQSKAGIIYNKGVTVTWEKTIAQYALSQREAGWKPLIGPVTLELHFQFPIPKGRKELRPGMAHLQDPDCTNLLKAAEDAIKGVLIADDNLVIRVVVGKSWCEQGQEGMQVKVEINEVS